MIVMVFMGFVVLAILIRILAGSSDRSRIDSEIASRGGTVLDVTWQPFGKGWFGEKNDRIYSVRYRDRDGLEREAWCKTSMMSGVYFADDRAIGASKGGQSAPSPEIVRLNASLEELEREHARLKAESARFERAIQERRA